LFSLLTNMHIDEFQHSAYNISTSKSKEANFFFVFEKSRPSISDDDRKINDTSPEPSEEIVSGGEDFDYIYDHRGIICINEEDLSIDE